MAGGTLPELDEALVVAQRTAALQSFQQFWDIRNAYYESYAAPANWVAVTGAGAGPAPEPPGAYSSAMPETMPAPVLDIQNPPEIEVNAPRVPLEDLTDEELLSIGTDSALYELDARRGVPESQRAFVPDPRFLPMIAPAIETVAAWVRSIPLIGLLIPRTGGKYDETEDLPIDFRPPRKPPRIDDAPLDPIMPPNWADMVDWDLFGVYQPVVPLIKDPYVQPIGDPVRRTAPPDIGPGVFEPFDDPLSVPELQPFRTPSPAPVRTPAPFVVPATPADPFSAPRRFADPFTTPVPGPFDFPDIPNPFRYPIGDPVTTAPPTPGTPTAPPGVFAPPGMPDLFVPPGLDPFQTPFAQPLAQPLGNPSRADPCNCADTKKKKKKEKRKPREVCYRGTFREYKDGTSKNRLEQVPCEPKKARLDKASKRGRSIAPAIPFFL